MLIYFKQLTLDEGFEVLAKPKNERLVNGRAVSPASGKSLFQAMRSKDQPLKCWECGIEGSCFIVNKHANEELRSPVIDLFAERDGNFVLMTRDHIIPRSYGGVDDVENLRIGCSPCNSVRGNHLNAADHKFMAEHPELITPEKLDVAKEMVALAEKKKKQKRAAAKRRRERKWEKSQGSRKLTSMMVLALA